MDERAHSGDEAEWKGKSEAEIVIVDDDVAFRLSFFFRPRAGRRIGSFPLLSALERLFLLPADDIITKTKRRDDITIKARPAAENSGRNWAQTGEERKRA